MEREIGTLLAEFAVKTKYEDIPEEVLQFTKGLTLKTVAGMLAGSVKPSGQKMAGCIRDQKLSEEVGIMGSSSKTSLWEAVFLHAFLLMPVNWRMTGLTAGYLGTSLLFLSYSPLLKS